MSNLDLITILGPTACGKTQLAVTLADQMDGEILSADSRQVYVGMDIGTGKDLHEYIINGRQIPYHLIDIAPAGYKYNVFEYQQDFLKAFQEVQLAEHQAIMCGGSGMYLESVIRGYNLLPVPDNAALRESLEGKTLEELKEILATYKDLHNNTDTDTPKRAIRAIEIADYYKTHQMEPREFPRLKGVVIGVDMTRDMRRERITKRLEERLESGMVEEVEALIEAGISYDDLIYYGLEYKYITLYLRGDYTFDQMKQKLEMSIHQFAKRQMTWFRGMERRGVQIEWIASEWDLDRKVRTCLNIVQRAQNRRPRIIR